MVSGEAGKGGKQEAGGKEAPAAAKGRTQEAENRAIANERTRKSFLFFFFFFFFWGVQFE